MNASKENCQKALDCLYFLHTEDNLTGFGDVKSVNHIREFLVAALKKLPKESSFAKEKERSNAKS